MKARIKDVGPGFAEGEERYVTVDCVTPDGCTHQFILHLDEYNRVDLEGAGMQLSCDPEDEGRGTWLKLRVNNVLQDTWIGFSAGWPHCRWFREVHRDKPED